MIKYIKYLFFLILFLSFSKGVHAETIYKPYWETQIGYIKTNDTDQKYSSFLGSDSNSDIVFNLPSGYYIDYFNIHLFDESTENVFTFKKGYKYEIILKSIVNSGGYNSWKYLEQMATTGNYSNYISLTANYGSISITDFTVTTSSTNNKAIITTSFTPTSNFTGVSLIWDFHVIKKSLFFWPSPNAVRSITFPLSIKETLINDNDAILGNLDNIDDSINNATDKITQEQQQTNQKLDDINNSITNDSPVSMDKLGNTAGWLPAGPVDSILNLPLSLMNSLSTSLNSQCSPLQINVPYIDTQIQIPCISTIFGQIEGLPNFWAWVGAIASCLILYKYLLNLYAWVDNVLMLRLEMHEDFGGNSTNFGSV